MSNLIPVNYDNDRQTVSAKALYDFLELDKSQWARWHKKNIEEDTYFAEGVDYVPLDMMSNGNATKDFQLTIEMAKELSMMARTEKGKQARQYFIELEKRWNSPEALMARALKMADRKLLEYKNKVTELQPKADFFDAVADSKSAIEMSQAAKVLSFGKGRNTLFKILREEGILRDNNEPYQEYIDRGYFRVVEQKYQKPTGDIEINIKTLVYQKGLDYVRKVLDKRRAV